jgi:hypothetical protein
VEANLKAKDKSKAGANPKAKAKSNKMGLRADTRE